MYAELNNLLIGFDRISTENYYSDQLTAKQNCSCTACAYFEDVFLKKDLQIFTFLKTFGVDVRKEQDVDPEGLWMILGTNDEFIRCTTDYVVFGDFDTRVGFDEVFQFIEESIRINIEIKLLDENALLIRMEYEPIT